MMLIDSHAHIYLPEFKDDIEAIIENAQIAGVKKILLPNIDSSSIDDMLRLSDKYPDICYPMIGLHPGSVKDKFEKELAIVENWLSKGSFVAVGEIGTDLYWDQTYVEQQKEAMRIQMQWAKNYKLPIVIHNRSSFELTYQLVLGEKDKELTGVFHCFTGNQSDAEKITTLGFYMGLGGVLTFKNSGLDQTVADLDLDNIILETDSPYLTPAPYRGKRNEPAYITHIAKKLATIKNTSLTTIAEKTSYNTQKLFNL